MSRIALGGAIPVALFASAMLGFISFDLAAGGISVMFIAAIIPGILENRKNRRGWSKQSTVMTASGLLSLGSMFILLGLPMTGGLTVVSGITWTILAIQSFVYATPRAAVPDGSDLEELLKKMLEAK